MSVQQTDFKMQGYRQWKLIQQNMFSWINFHLQF